MKCPRCGHEMTLDTHRKYPAMMCYDCGYMEGRVLGPEPKKGETNFAYVKRMELNEAASYLAEHLGLNAEKLAEWLADTKA